MYQYICHSQITSKLFLYYADAFTYIHVYTHLHIIININDIYKFKLLIELRKHIFYYFKNWLIMIFLIITLVIKLQYLYAYI